MKANVKNNSNLANAEIPGKKEAKGVVYIVLKSEDHYDDVVTVFSRLDDAMEYCAGKERFHINISNVF